MMAVKPKNPKKGDTWTGDKGAVYEWNGNKWVRLKKNSNDWLDFARGEYGWVADLYDSVGDIQSILDKAVKGKWTADRFKNAVQSTEWWKSKDAKDRQFEQESITDPTTQANNIATTRLNIDKYLSLKGYQLGDTEAQSLAVQAYKYRWDQNEIERYVGAEIVRSGKAGSGQGIQQGVDMTKVNDLAFRYGLKLPEATKQRYLDSLIQGTLSEQQVEDSMRADAMNLYPALRSQLEMGRSVEDSTAPYRQVASQVLNIDPMTIDFTDGSKWGKLLSYQDPNNNEVRMMNVNEWTKFLRKTPEWQETDEAKNIYRELSSTLLRAFGKVR
jgi:hypothetical protein